MQAQLSTENSIISAQQFILCEQKRNISARGEFSWLLSAIIQASKQIAMQVRRAGLNDILGKTGTKNVHGETVEKMDELADALLIESLGRNADVAIISSEENENAVILRESGGKYVVFFDPLDGSSNLNVGVSVGTIFSIMEKPDHVDDRNDEPHTDEIILQPGTKQLAAGYIVYGSSTVLVLTTGEGVHMFTLDPTVGDYLLSKKNIQMPSTGNYYSINEGNEYSFPPGYREWLDALKKEGTYSGRYIGSLVADFHRTLLKGGIFAYPATEKAPDGKLRLMYEANPIAFLAEQAGGVASTGSQRILDIQPTSLHQRVPLLVGSSTEVEKLLNFI